MTMSKDHWIPFANRMPVRFAANKLLAVLLVMAAGVTATHACAATFLKPTAEELSMTSLPGYPGASAVVLFREELTRDDMHAVQHYERLKILTEDGKKYANVALGFYSSLSGFYGSGDNKVLDEISGRTIHPDGRVIPFTGKPYLKVIEQTRGYKVQQIVFTLPDVEVGSVIEYQYFTRIDDHIFEAPIWHIQDDLYVREAHFAWWPTTHYLVDEDEKPINTITWFPVLPAGANLERHEVASTGMNGGTGQMYEVRVKDVPPRVREEYMPPIGSFSYRVNFSFSPYRSPQEYWQATGKQWSKRVNNFAGPNAALRSATAEITGDASTSEEKLQRIYAAVMKIENTRYTRERDQREDKAAGMGEIKSAADLLTHKRGSPTQITDLFVGMARAAGLQAYAMWVPDREQDLFTSSWLDTRQLDDTIAVVKVDGKEEFFDPGSRYSGFGQLAWQHTAVQGLRQIEGGTKIDLTPSPGYKENHVSRVADLHLNDAGEVTGKVNLTFTVAPALRWRQTALEGDDESLRKALREHAERMLPDTLEIEVANIQALSEYDKPLVVSYTVKGSLGSGVGKRTMLPADVFQSHASATFPHEKRQTAVYFPYPEVTQDAVRITLPPKYAIEALPSESHFDLEHREGYSMRVTQTANSFTTRRDLASSDIVVLVSEYPGLRSFYSQMESKDHESVVLKLTDTSAATAVAPIAHGNQ